MPSAINEAKLWRRATHGSMGWLWITLPFVFFGYLACIQLFSFASRFHDGGLAAIAAALVALPVLAVFALAFRQGLTYARAFAPTLTWWHVLWMITLASSLVFRIRRAGDITTDPLDAWAVYRAALDMVVFFVLLGRLALRRTHWVGSMLRGVVGALTVYGLVCVASMAWSVFPSWTLFKSWEYLVDVALLAAILETLDSVEDYRNFFNWTWVLYGLMLLCVWKDELLWPHEVFLHAEGALKGAVLQFRLNGVLPLVSSNDVSTFAAILGLISLARLFPSSDEERFNKVWYTLLFLGSMATMVVSQNRTAFGGFLFAVVFILLYSKRGKLSAFLALAVAPTVAFLTMGGLVWSYLSRGQNQEQLADMSLRADWWALAWQKFLEQPLTGYGAYAAGRFAVMASAGYGLTGTMHSDYLEVIVGTGIWGMIPLIAALAGTWWLLWRFVRNSADPQERQLAYESVIVLALLTFRSVFNNMMTIHPPLPFLAVVGYAEFLRRRRKAWIEYDPIYRSGLGDSQEDLAAKPVLD
jgi:O-antigen ligase